MVVIVVIIVPQFLHSLLTKGKFLVYLRHSGCVIVFLVLSLQQRLVCCLHGVDLIVAGLFGIVCVSSCIFISSLSMWILPRLINVWIIV